MTAKTNYLENKIIDWLFRGQTFTPPPTLYFGLMTANADDAATLTEVSGGSYARVALTPSLANFAGTQGAGTTVASTGTTATTSNNIAITYPAPTANWGGITGMGIWDAPSGGNLLVYTPLSTPKTVNNGDAAPTFAAGAFTYQDDN